jgi:hypothetical protein
LATEWSSSNVLLFLDTAVNFLLMHWKKSNFFILCCWLVYIVSTILFLPILVFWLWYGICCIAGACTCYLEIVYILCCFQQLEHWLTCFYILRYFFA